MSRSIHIIVLNLVIVILAIAITLLTAWITSRLLLLFSTCEQVSVGGSSMSSIIGGSFIRQSLLMGTIIGSVGVMISTLRRTLRYRSWVVNPDPGKALVGEVRGLNFRTENPPDFLLSVLHLTGSKTVMSFRLHRKDEDESASSFPIPVQMRWHSIEGVINDGDEVEIEGRWHPGQTLFVNSIRNLTTRGTVHIKDANLFSQIVIPFIVGYLGLYLILVIKFVNCFPM